MLRDSLPRSSPPTTWRTCGSLLRGAITCTLPTDRRGSGATKKKISPTKKKYDPFGRFTMEVIFNEVLKVVIKCRHCDERKEHIRVTIELDSSAGAVRKRDLLVRLTNDADPHFLFSLAISEEDFQSLKVQQSLLIEFTSFPEMLTQLLRQCQSEQNCSHPRFQLLLSCDSPSLDGPAQLNVMESSSFKHLNQLSLQLAQASDKHVKDYLAACLASLKADKEALEVKLQTTEDDLTKRLHNAEQALSEKSTEMERLRSEWTLQSSSLSSRHADELRSERERAAELQERLRQETQQVRRDLESAHQRSSQQMQSRLAQLETSCGELGDRNFKNEAALRDLKSKLAGAEEECRRLEQQVGSLRRDKDSADAELHAKERLAEQLRARMAALQQEVEDKEWKMSRTQEALTAAQQQQGSLRKSADGKEAQLRQLEAQVEFLEADVKKGNEIIKKFQRELQVQQDKNKDKSAVLVAQEKIVRDTSAKLERAHQEAQDARRQLDDKDRQIASLKEQLESSVKQLSDTKEVLQNNKTVIGWLNKQLDEKRLHENFPEPSENAPMSLGPRAHFSPHATASRPNDFAGGLDARYFKRDDGIPVYGLAGALIPRELPPPRSKAPVASAYFPS
ncbi:spindle assembly abnormal protein 6 homolog [Hippocampus comes]|uniref:Spindle assembly abnormal protein 6 homolog n=1 Tax=Hippocampus comes TaxID=109280 RepID=A0A3Q3DV06_HIPCM|nr:PREDICTED: spindle assembly abnormal protein 6 homolog [Hippocampus comes]